MNDKFYPNTIYELVDANGFAKEGYRELAAEIISMGGTITPLIVDFFTGRVLTFAFSDTAVVTSKNFIDSEMVKYFKPLSTVGISAISVPPKKLPPAEADANLIEFPRPNKSPAPKQIPRPSTPTRITPSQSTRAILAAVC